MLTIRMQRTGRKGLANFRVVVQDSRFAPNSGRVVAQLGHYNPHTKETVIDKEKATQYLQNGAQPSPRVVRLLQAEKVVLPDWVTMPAENKKRSIKNPEKLRKNQPKEEAPAAEILDPEDVTEAAPEVVKDQAPAEATNIEAEKTATDTETEASEEQVADSEEPTEPVDKKTEA